MVDERETEAVPLVKEELRVDKWQVSTGKVQVHTVVDTAEDVIRETLDEKQVEVTRVPINKVVSTKPSVRTEDGVIIVPVVEEVLVIERRLVLKEEVHICRHISHKTVEVPVSSKSSGPL
jgi:stress response protein YsnF